jgi:hypothetical protein
MYERARSIDGSLAIEGRAGGGTVVAVRLPLTDVAAPAPGGRESEPGGLARYAGALRVLRLRLGGAARSARIRA